MRRAGDKVHCTPTPRLNSPSTVAFIHLVNNGSGVCVWATGDGGGGQWECNDNDDNGLLWCHHVVFIIVSSLIIILSQFGVTVLRLIAHVILVNKLFCYNHKNIGSIIHLYASHLLKINIEAFAFIITSKFIDRGVSSQVQFPAISVDPELEWHLPIEDCRRSIRVTIGPAYYEIAPTKS